MKRKNIRKGNITKAFYRFRKNRIALICFFFIIFEIIIAIFAPLLAPYPEDAAGKAVHFSEQFLPPSRDHLCGTDEAGRDILSRLIFGARITFRLVVVVLTISFFIGVPLGICAGYFEGIVGQVIMRITDIFLSVPALVAAMGISAVMKPTLEHSMLAIGFVWWRSFCRLSYGETLSIKQEDFIEVSHSLGASHLHIMFREILPNITSSLIIALTLDSGYAILLGAALSFLGLGAHPPTPEWGIMISEGRLYLPTYWWLSVFPGLVIFITVLSINLFGDGLRDFFAVEEE